MNKLRNDPLVFARVKEELDYFVKYVISYEEEADCILEICDEALERFEVPNVSRPLTATIPTPEEMDAIFEYFRSQKGRKRKPSSPLHNPPVSHYGGLR